MDSNLLKYLAFVETVDKGSFTKAADSLNYAQSSISKMIADHKWNSKRYGQNRNFFQCGNQLAS